MRVWLFRVARAGSGSRLSPMPSVELTPEELELLADMAAWKAREHWRLTVQARTEKERTYGLFLDGLSSKLRAAQRKRST